jgi:hypothetical protein
VWLWNLVSYTVGGTRLRVFQNGALNNIFGSKWDNVTKMGENA